MTKRLVVLILLLCVLVPDGQAATCTSRQSGNWSISSTWNCGSGSSNGPPASSDSAVISTYTVSLSNSPSVAAVTVNSGATLQQTGFSNRTLTVSGDFVNYGTLVDGSSGSLTLSVGGNLTNAATAFTVDALTVTGSTTSSSSLIVKGTFTTYGDLTVNGGTYSAGSVVFAGSGTQAATFYGLASSVGNLTVNSGSTVSSTNWSTLTVTGNLVNSGSISLPNTAWTFAGSLAQTLSGNAFSFYNLTLSNAAGLTLGMSPSVSNLLTLTSGIVTTGSNILTASANCPGSLAGYSGTSYVNGNLRLTYAAWPVTCVYPVGTSTAYAPITVSIPWFWGIAGGTLTGSTTDGEHPQIASAGINSAKDANRYWTLGTTGDTMSSLPTGGSYDLSLAFVAADVDSGATVANFKVGTYASSAWGTLSGSASGTTATATGLTSFGSYATGEPGSTPSTCNPPAGAPSGVTCYCDNFARSTLNPSTIFSSNWAVSSGSGSFGVPKIVNPGYLRLTDASGNVSTAATVPGIFPAAGNYISVEFKNYAYYGSGADGIVMTLSNYATPAVPGAYGGSLGYAQQTGINGFAGGWIGVALDEFGNYSNPTEGRVLGPGFYAQSVGARGPGSGTNGYRWMGGSTAVGGVDNSGSTSAAPGNQYQVIVDARNSSTNSILVWVNRDSTTKNGTNYTALFGGTGGFNAYTEAAYALSQGWTTSLLPANWQISFTGSTGGSTNIHEIGGLKICAQSVLPPTAGSSASNFNAIDDAYGTSVSYITAQQGHIYTKLAGSNFNLNVIAFTNSGTAIDTVYANMVVVQLIDDSGGTSCNASAATCGSCAKPVLASQTMTYTSSNAGQMVTPTAFNLSSAYSRVIARICQGSSCSGATTVSCSSDAFSVRPTNLTVSSTATQAGTTGTPKFKAGTDSFTMTATANAANYTGMPKISTSATQANGGGGTLGSLIPSAFASASGTTSSSTTSFTYSEVGNFQFLGYSPSSDTTSSRGVYDDSWTATTDGPTNDCVSGSYANTKNAGGKYGCNFGLSANSGTFGRFYPDHFRASTIFVPRSDLVRTTTGSISAGSTTLTVASAIGIAAGNTLVVLGAGVAGMPLQTTVSSVSGTTVALAAGASTTVSSATVYDTTSAASSTFSYMGEPMLVLTSLVAQNGSGGTTTNYITSGTATLNFAKLSAATLTSCSSWFVAAASSSCSTTNPQYFGFGAIDGTATPLTSGLAMYFAPSSANWVSGVSTFTTNLTLARNPSSPAGPYEAFRLGEVPADDDGVTVLASALNLDADASGTSERQLVATGKERYGRLRLSNAYGSELLGLQVPVRAEYYAGGVWVLNSIDSSTSIANPKNDIALGNCTGTLSCATGGNMDPATHLPTTAVTLNAGINTITLAKPTCTSGPCPAGGLDLALTLGSSGTNDNCVSPALSAATSGASLSWLQYAWCTGKTDPNARATFGVAKNRFIYLRERY